MQLNVTFLSDPTSSATGKFYIGVLDPKQPFALYGANTQNNQGTYTAKNTEQELRTLLQQKQRKNYNPCAPSAVPDVAIQHAWELACQHHGIAKNTPRTLRQNGNGYVFDLSGGGPTTPQNKPNTAARPRPKTAKMSVKVWI